MASYNVRSPLNFHRMLSKNKKNDELQRLKDEYERIKDFSDYTIALRIRQVRLWRLFRKIQDINAVSSARAKPPRKQPKTYEQIRAEALSRARDLGMEFSRENGLNMQRQTQAPHIHISMLRLGEKPIGESKISATARRLTYGNVTSHENMRRFRSKRKPVAQNTRSSNGLRSASSIEVDRLEKLRKCITYDGLKATSSGSKARLAKGKSPENRIHIKNPPNTTGSSSGDLREHDLIKNYTFVLEESSARQSDVFSESIDNQEDYLVNLWNELKVRIPILKSVPLKELIRTQRRGLANILESTTEERTEEQLLNESCDSLPEQSYEEFELRKIDNDRNLPTSQLRYNGQKPAGTLDDTLEDSRITENEKVVRISDLNDDESRCYYNSNDSEKDNQSSSSTECAVSNMVVKERKEKKVPPHPSLKNKPLTSLDLRTAQHPMLMETHVEEFVKLYEPFPRFHEPETEQTIKENFESGVVKLRSIFEHQGE